MLKVVALILCCTLLLSCDDQKVVNENPDKPNILLLVADDLGYADLGCYGSDIETPNIDQLAANGIRFSNFHTANMCAPSRAMLLSGNDNHIAGIGAQGLETDVWGYEGMLTKRIATLPQILRDAGYHTYIAGKWHLGTSAEANPHQKGFEHSFVLLEGAGNHYDDQGLFEDYPVSPYTEDGQVASWQEGNYSTNFYTDKLIEYIERYRKDRKPFFAFATYTSPHWPLQVDEKYWRKYEGRYDEGYEKLKEQRLESLKSAGLISQEAILPPNHKNIKAWDSLSALEKKIESRKMELYSGMVDNLDENIGRLIQYLKETGEYENTIIVFMADNGAAAEDFYHDEEYSAFIREHFNEDFENMGQPNSFISYGPQWAEAGSSPFRFYKGFTTEGGIVAPMIISGPNIKRKNQIYHGFLSLMDLAPTFYEVAGTAYPRIYNDIEVYPLLGKSILPFLNAETAEIHSSDYVFGHEHYNKAMIRKGNWKITSIERPFSEENFKLYNLDVDLAEVNDLKEEEPEKYNEMLDEWRKFSGKVGVQVPVPQ